MTFACLPDEIDEWAVAALFAAIADLAGEHGIENPTLCIASDGALGVLSAADQMCVVSPGRSSTHIASGVIRWLPTKVDTPERPA